MREAVPLVRCTGTTLPCLLAVVLEQGIPQWAEGLGCGFDIRGIGVSIAGSGMNFIFRRLIFMRFMSLTECIGGITPKLHIWSEHYVVGCSGYIYIYIFFF